MKSHLFKLAILAATMVAMHASGPEEAYAKLYQTIRQADELLTRGSEKEALIKYFEAQSGLKSLSVLHPGWQKKVVDFRLHYLDLRIQPLASKFEAKADEAVATTSASAPEKLAVDPVPAITPAAEAGAPVSILQKQVQALIEQNARLIERLRQLETASATSTRPAATAQPEIVPASMSKPEVVVTTAEPVAKAPKRSFWDRFKRKKYITPQTSEPSVSQKSSRELKSEERRIKKAQARAQAKLNKLHKQQQRKNAEAKGGSRRLAGNTGAR